MPRFLSPQWADELNAALDGADLPGPGPDAGLAAAGGRFTVSQEVRGAPGGDLRLVLSAEGGRLRVALGPLTVPPVAEDGPGHGDPEVTIALSYEDAAALSRGDVSPAEALNAGRIRVRGDLSVLVAAQEMLAAARASTGLVAASTTY